MTLVKESNKKEKDNMGALINLVGQKFHHLTVLERATNIGRQTAWLCQCDCPNATKIVVRGADLKNGHTKSGGCQRIAANIKRNNEANICSIL